MANLSTPPQQKADGSSSSASTSCPRYDVFINHRGPDVKNTFVSHLDKRLREHGLWLFLDRPELQAGHNIKSQIEAAILVASVHIAIFSPTYAQSTWCLDELVLMLKSGAPIVPIFFNVEPSEVRWNDKKGAYAEALKELEQKTSSDPQTNGEKPRHDSATIQGWRAALSHVANLKGCELKGFNGNEQELLDEVVRNVLKKLPKTPLFVAKYPTGLDDKLQDFESTVLSQQGQERDVQARVVGIIGVGGIGKTTLVKQIFNRRCSGYDGSSFLSDVSETAARKSLVDLQMKLIKDLTHRDIKIEIVDQGVIILKRYLACCNAMIVLDNVEKADQLDAFLPIRDVLSSNSLIIVTSRDKHALLCSEIADSSIYKLTGMPRAHSQELFCSYAFNQPHPPTGFIHLVERFVRACDGLPLSLKVTGALLCGRDDTYWKELLQKFHKIPPADIRESLKISYNSLDQEYQQIFLDMACFSIGEDMDTAKRIWGAVGVSNLESKCLLELDSGKRIKMHDQVRDMGRYTAAERSMPHRLWCHATNNNNVDKLFEESSWSVTTEVRGISTVHRVDGFHYGFGVRSEMSWYKRCIQELLGNCKPALFNTDRYHGLRILASEDYYVEAILRRVRSPHLIWLRWYKCPYSSLPSWVPLGNLRVLEVRGSRLKTLWQQESQPPLQLRELNIYSPVSDFPKSIGQLKYLEKIVVDYDGTVQLKTLPEEFCYMHSLTDLVLRHFTRMRSLPDCLGKLTNLQDIDLSYATSLEMLPDSIGKLPNLQSIDLSYCYRLAMLPNSFGNLTRLKRLSLKECRNVKELPPQVAHQRFLEEIYLVDAELKELPSGVGDLCNLEVLHLGDRLLEVLPSSLGSLNSLKDLRVSNCPRLKCLPDTFGRLTQLTELSLVSCGTQKLPQDILLLNNLEKFVIKDCPLGELPFKTAERERDSNGKCIFGLERLREFELDGVQITEVSFPEGVCRNLKMLWLSDCKELRQIGRLCGIYDCENVKELTSLEKSLEKLFVIGCSKLKSIQALEHLPNLRQLEVHYCDEIEVLPSLEHLTSLCSLYVFGCSKLKTIQGLEHLTKLEYLGVGDLAEIEELPALENLWSLGVVRCPKFKCMQGLEQFRKLKYLCVAKCAEIEEMRGVEHLMSLRTLYVEYCPKLQWRGRVVEQLRQRLKGRFSYVKESKMKRLWSAICGARECEGDRKTKKMKRVWSN
eukprot:PITA_31903